MGKLINADIAKEALRDLGYKGAEQVIDSLPDGRGQAVWEYYTNDENKARWRCTSCGKICKQNPSYKRFCSICGTPIRMES